LVSFVFDALLHWIEDGDPAHDHEFLARVDASLPALVAAWASVTPPDAPPRAQTSSVK
jgi:hypothetical protein